MCVSEGTLFTLILTAGLCVRVRRRETCVSEGYVALVHEQCDAGQLGGLLLQLTVGVRNGDATQSTSNVVRRLGLGICPSTSHHTITHSLSLVLVVMMKSKELKTKISHAYSLILAL